MSERVVQVAVVVLFALTCGVLVAAWIRARLGTAIAVCLVAFAAWVLTFVAITAEFGDANDFATCTTSCTAVHYVAAVAFVVSPLLIALAGLAMIVARSSRWRLRWARENHF